MVKQTAQDRYRVQRWMNVCPTEYQRTDRRKLPKPARERMADILKWKPTKTGLILAGPTGAGKSRLAWLLARQLYFDGLGVVAFTALQFEHACAVQFGAGDGERWVYDLTQTELLFLDDFGKGRFTDRTEAELFGIVETRTSWNRPILITTNLTGKQLAQQAQRADRGAALARRLREFCDVVVIPGA